MPQNKKKIILICSGGGHLSELLQLEEMFTRYDYLLVTDRTPVTAYFKDAYNISFLRARPQGSTHRALFLPTMLVNFFLSARILLKHYPRAIIAMGTHTSVPMCLLARILRIKIVFILSYARVNSNEKAADMIYPIADKFIVQWPDMEKHYEKAIFLGGVF